MLEQNSVECFLGNPVSSWCDESERNRDGESLCFDSLQLGLEFTNCFRQPSMHVGNETLNPGGKITRSDIPVGHTSTKPLGAGATTRQADIC